MLTVREGAQTSNEHTVAQQCICRPSKFLKLGLANTISVVALHPSWREMDRAIGTAFKNAPVNQLVYRTAGRLAV